MVKNKDSLCILQVNTQDLDGGAARVAWNLHKVYRQLGYSSWLTVGCRKSMDPDVFVIPNDYARSHWARLCLYIQKRLQVFEGEIRGLWRLNRMLHWIADPISNVVSESGQEDFNYPKTWRLLDSIPRYPDIMHCHNLHGGYFDLRAISWLSQRVPTILTLHDAWLLSGHCAHSFECERWIFGCGHCPDLNIYPSVKRDATAYNWRRKRSIYARSKLYVATPCRWLMGKVEKSILAAAILKNRVIPYGVDLTVFHPGDQKIARDKLGLSLNADILLFVSHGITQTPWRDYIMLEKIIQSLSYRAKRRPTIMICLGEERKDKKFGDVEIRFVPFVRDSTRVASYYQAADVYIHPSKIDTFPNVILEALACGLPVVSTSVGGIPEQVDDGKTGFLVSPGDMTQMINRVAQLLEDKNMWQSFSQKASEAARQRFNLNQEVENYLNWYEEILDERYDAGKRSDNSIDKQCITQH